MTSSSRFRVRSAIVLALPAIVLAGCGSRDSTEPEVRTEVRTVTVEATATPPTIAPTSIDRIVLPDTTAPEPSTSEPAAPVLVAMPPVVCMNLQSAQNAIQAAGVFYSRSADASGEGRMQVNDSNWIVVAQDPPAGTLIAEGDALLSAVKIGEPNNC
ncbi:MULTISPECIES: PASTA domain-containing protein [unclassified Rhodococcus (in: high G+C Gram-positive bacteria)]|uniref:PASTA domain-containing protein n=1 Tax=unclassified Rhodococcus (in: high G+C Gram-positive bacteria) TaxID=192944 RepID=UPI00211B1A23|nr:MULTISPECIES: PASTA domain-containing protein [unclassified Rhodococcus (in: high G+C Gram-positive bacteria)]